MIYLLDTNVISDLLALQPNVHQQIIQHQEDTLGLCRPVYYELLRGLIWKRASNKITVLRNELIPKFTWIALLDKDWDQAARFWANAVSSGRQLADTDLLLAAMVYRLNAVLVSADQDYDVLPIKRGNWRIS